MADVGSFGSNGEHANERGWAELAIAWFDIEIGGTDFEVARLEIETASITVEIEPRLRADLAAVGATAGVTTPTL